MLVVVTILSILSTIAFVSFAYQTRKARDAARSTNLKSISRVLDLHYLDEGKYPHASNAVPIYYSGALVWEQGTFGDESIVETGKIFGELKDPLYGNEYAYSVTANQKEYQLAAVFESEERA